uniref:Uncharacterized protein n=2 Tax=Gracilariopsis TaxID=2781 RepID=A0A1C9CF16_9FLOR|nr:photosystem I assembly protein Ycf37 [Gracilariopsis lemaneiformis]YP_009294705.1 hypothetical protein Gch_106 [Gracilariopsis chorda]AJO68351.1 hypothetical protein [Gracilariopsis lemaneiformis]AML79950.1 photosystem I assembly protein Ycf37 [Gracilariopsis lemaneiformis]AOM66965.1 hypothetical protein Gch_106 [Gracilariopsis chorda]UAD88773.1 hypothetical protein [Gracilariopsis chorda]
MFELYLILVISLLIPISYSITNSLRTLYKQAYILQEIFKLNNKHKLPKDYISNLVKVYIKRKKWLDCTTMLEFHINQKQNSQSIAEYYNYLGLCYQYVKLYEIAKSYYLQAYTKEPSINYIIKNLANIYQICGDKENANKMKNKYLVLNENKLNEL